MVEALEIIAKPTALGVIVCLVIAVSSLGMAYKFGTAETHEQCIAGDQGRDYQECWEHETRPGPDIEMAITFAFFSIIPIAFIVQIIRPRVQLIRPRQRRNVTPTPWWAFWR